MSTNHGGLGVRNSAAFYLLIYISGKHIPHYVAQATMAIWELTVQCHPYYKN